MLSSFLAKFSVEVTCEYQICCKWHLCFINTHSCFDVHEFFGFIVFCFLCICITCSFFLFEISIFIHAFVYLALMIEDIEDVSFVICKSFNFEMQQWLLFVKVYGVYLLPLNLKYMVSNINSNTFSNINVKLIFHYVKINFNSLQL